MNTHLQTAKDVLFGEEGLRASNFKLFFGRDRTVPSERIAQEIHESIVRIQGGDFELIAELAD